MPDLDPLAAAGSIWVPDAAAGERLDRFLLGCLPAQTRSGIQRLVEGGHVRVNGQGSRAGYRVRRGDEVAWEIPPPRSTDIIAEDIPLAVLYEDADLIVIDKPKGMVVHPAPGHWRGTLVNALLGRPHPGLASGSGAERPGIVHRLDKDTSGVLVIARNEATYRSLQGQIHARTTDRRYLAVVHGHPRFREAVVEAPLGRHPKDRKRMAVIPPGSEARSRLAVTHLRVLEEFDDFALLEARLETGRTHQIRVHCAHIGLPVAGDATYGPAASRSSRVPAAVRAAIAGLQGQALHAAALAFDHPRTGERLSFSTPPPADTQALLDALREPDEPEAA